MKSTLVKIFLGCNLVLCAIVLGVSFKTFTDREVIKARSVIHRGTINKVAENLSWGETLNWEDPADRKAALFQLPNPQNMNEVETFTSQLEELAVLAEKRVEQLSEQFSELTKTQTELEETRSTLSDRIADLVSTRSQIASLEGSLRESKNSISESNTEFAGLERETSSLKQQIDGLDNQLTNQQTLISQIVRDLELRTGERNRVEELLRACLQPQTETTAEKGAWHQRTARILAVEPTWNYVVINKGEVDVLPMFLEAFVHRGDELVGKIRVMQVERTVALAEIINDSVTPGMTIQSGDTLFF